MLDAQRTPEARRETYLLKAAELRELALEAHSEEVREEFVVLAAQYARMAEATIHAPTAEDNGSSALG